MGIIDFEKKRFTGEYYSETHKRFESTGFVTLSDSAQTTGHARTPTVTVTPTEKAKQAADPHLKKLRLTA